MDADDYKEKYNKLVCNEHIMNYKYIPIKIKSLEKIKIKRPKTNNIKDKLNESYQNLAKKSPLKTLEAFKRLYAKNIYQNSKKNKILIGFFPSKGIYFSNHKLNIATKNNLNKVNNINNLEGEIDEENKFFENTKSKKLCRAYSSNYLLSNSTKPQSSTISHKLIYSPSWYGKNIKNGTTTYNWELLRQQQQWINKIPHNYKRIFSTKLSCSSCQDQSEALKMSKIKQVLKAELSRGIFKTKRLNGIPPCILYSLNRYPTLKFNSEDEKINKLGKEYYNLKYLFKQGKTKNIKCADLISELTKNRDKVYYKEISRNELNPSDVISVQNQNAPKKIDLKKKKEGKNRMPSPRIQQMTALEEYYFKFGASD